MTEPESSELLSEGSPTAVSAAEAEREAAEPQPEPWTPERVIEWNAYYDLYVVLGVLLLVFVSAANKITYSPIWTSLQAGRTMAAEGRPLLSDTFSYTEAGRRWVNIPWLFQWSHALIFDQVFKAAPADPADLAGSTQTREQIAAGALVALSALARVATVLLLLGIRRRGPGLWWSAVCAMIALGGFLSPIGPAMGGIAGTALVEPLTWGLLLLALELFLWHRTVDQGRPGAVLGLVPVFLVWANLDDSFLIGLLLLAAGVVGRRGRQKDDPLPMPRGLKLLAACALVCLVNPSFYRVFPAAAWSLFRSFATSPLIPGHTRREILQLSWLVMVPFLFVLALGFGTFALNRRNFSLSRLLMYAAAALLLVGYLAERGVFAVVLAATVAANGQEWYRERFGTIGRLGRGWSVWSVGGRAVTIVLVFGFVAIGLTGWGKSVGDPVFGFGFNPDAFEFPMAEFLRTSGIKGRVLNTKPGQGDALVWRARPERPTYLDSRQHVFTTALIEQLEKTRTALSEDEVAVWKPLLDKYEITAVIVDEVSSPRTVQKLFESPNWIAFYDDGSVWIFGRADAPAADLAYFRAHQLVASSLVYQKPRPVPPPDTTPTPTTWIDGILRNRTLHEPQPHTNAALHWIQGQGRGDHSETGLLPDPAHCLMAIQEARIALSRRPDDSGPFRVLSEAYRVLMVEEAALLNGLALTPENAEAILRTEPKPSLLMNRFRQRATALNSAIQTTPPPNTPGERQALALLNFQLYQLYMTLNDKDLARDRLQAMILLVEDRSAQREMIADLKQQLAGLNQQVTQIKNDVNDQMIAQQLGPLQRAAIARGQGAPGLAIQELEEAERTGISPALVRPLLVDLYCDTGQPERAHELLNSGNVEDPSLGMEPGVAAMRQARVNFLLGFYEYAARLWEERAIFQLRYQRSGQALSGGLSFLQGAIKPALTLFLDLPGKIAQQAAWEYDLGLCELESGNPDKAAAPLTEALTLNPDLPLRRVAAYYLEKLGKPVPPPSKVEPEKPATGTPN